MTGILMSHMATARKNFSVAYETDPYYNNVSLLLHMNGTNGSTTFTDSSTNNITVTSPGTVTISTLQSKFGGASAVFSGNNISDHLTCTLNQTINPRTDIFSVESWVYKNTGSVYVLFSMGTIGSDLYLVQSGSLIYLGDGLTNIISFPETLIDTNTWVHVAVTFDLTNYRIFINGTLIASSSTLLKNVTSNILKIGARPQFSNQIFSGYMDEFRVTKGVARYINNFTPPQQPFPNQ